MLIELLRDDFVTVRYFAFESIKNIVGKEEAESRFINIPILVYKCKDCGEKFYLSQVTADGCTKCHSKKFDKVLDPKGYPSTEEIPMFYDPSQNKDYLNLFYANWKQWHKDKFNLNK